MACSRDRRRSDPSGLSSPGCRAISLRPWTVATRTCTTRRSSLR
jgi:hypothetical protein